MTEQPVARASAPEPATVRVEDEREGVRVLVIDRPAQRNALDHATYLALSAAIREADTDPGVRVSIITGAGGTFTSGNDIEDFRKGPQPETRGGTVLFDALLDARKPILAAVEGHAVGIGVTMLLHCDLAYAGAGTRFRMPFTALGLSPEGASSYLLPRLAGDKRAAELLMLGEWFDAADAADAGIINRVVDQGGALAEALDRASALVALPAASIEATKALLRKHRAVDVREALQVEYEVFAERLASDEAQEAFRSFQNKGR
ncbi:enoyl-CoA hydratase-related protein [Paeniglutamicibacter psychrophenolicus]|uniref:Enoyl-CoA hydratase/carnithine racemase n=1 Tax=Paeniglutamicibacter psychrophenolicus TaxID=257454 RepID=A0ABS4W9K3_9MICC|nr:enoyl-CoA hydratase-related protein [Paeniglutamicibacter psychrophenolicus]MBP2372875.1 enoyl-CoA hydratase/carnithine racemase [Paeniglutamicibacter psychrophenolicus]